MNNTVQQLQNCMKQEAALVEQFILVLQAEAEALAQPSDTDALKASTQEKNYFSDLLAQIGQKRQTHLRELGFDPDKAGLDAAALAYPALKPSCLSLFDAARKASALNTSNGTVIDIYLKHNQQALDALQRLSGIDPLYDANGRVHSVPAHKKGIKAG